MKKDKVVYLHKKKSNGEVFYVGIGSKNRPYQMRKKNRSKFWWSVVEKHGIEVDVINRDLSWDDACYIEQELIEAFGRRDVGTGQLVNQTNGGDGNRGNIKQNGGDNPYAKPVLKLDNKGNLIKRYAASVLTEEDGYYRNAVRRAAHGTRGHNRYKGYIWKWE